MLVFQLLNFFCKCHILLHYREQLKHLNAIVTRESPILSYRVQHKHLKPVGMGIY